MAAPIYKTIFSLFFSFRKDYIRSMTSGKDAQSNHTIKYSLFDGVSCADSVEVFSRILQRLLFSNAVSWVKELGSHPPLYSQNLLARAPDWPLDPYYMAARAPDWPLDPYYMAARAPGLARIWLSANFGGGAGLNFGPLLYGGAGAGLNFGPLLYDGAGARPCLNLAKSQFWRGRRIGLCPALPFTPRYDIRPG